MKKSDIAMLILIASVSVLVAFLIARSLPFLKVDPKGEKVKVIDSISSTTVDPDPKVFHQGAINPTVETIIGN